MEMDKMLLNEQWVTEEIKKETRNKDDSTQHIKIYRIQQKQCEKESF